jgi:hypothetical protein
MLYFKSDVVLIGQVTSTDTIKDSGGDRKGWSYTLKVIKSYRGAAVPTMKVFTANDSGKLPLEVGKTYLLFASQVDGRLSIGYDEVSGELKDAQQALKDLDKIMARRPDQGGDVYGRITKRVFDPDTGGLGGIAVNIQGAAGSAHAMTDENGWFKVHVHAGNYSAMAANPSWKFQSQDMAWEDSDTFLVPDGGCAEIQIQAVPNSRE